MFILASGSPRRRELLQQIGCVFSVRVSHADEDMANVLPPERLVVQNACAKAKAVAEKDGSLPVLGADTVVVLDGQIYGKPTDEEEAKRMLRRLAGKTHRVLTGIAFVTEGEVFSDVVATEVCFSGMTAEEIDRYVATGEPMDKAGAYALQGRAAAFIEGIRGSWSNVVGLPLHAVCRLAGKAKVDLYGDHGEGSSGGGTAEGKAYDRWSGMPQQCGTFGDPLAHRNPREFSDPSGRTDPGPL